MRILVTGAAGFIGYHCCEALLQEGHEVFGVDSLDPYYNVRLKKARIRDLETFDWFDFIKADLARESVVRSIWRRTKPDRVLHLAAQAGVRHSIDHPMAYIRANVLAFQNVIEAVRAFQCENFVYASSSSVYGGSQGVPLRETDSLRPANLYAATKASNEQVAKAYGELFQLPSTGFRFFTVYGEWGRPDMAMWKFARAMLRGEFVKLFNHGNMARDFTYVGDIVSGVKAALLGPPRSGAVYNLGGGSRVGIPYVVECLEREMGIRAHRAEVPHQLGDVQETMSDCSAAREDLGYVPKTPIEVGIGRFAAWYRKDGVRF